MLCQVRYEWDCCGKHGGTVLYWLEGDRCIFSGVTRDTSTINAAESVVKAICAKEHVSPERITFFDLQTSRGYPKPESEFHFDRLVLKIEGGEVFCLDWVSTPCPNDVRSAFTSLLSEEMVQTNDPRKLHTEFAS